MQKLVYYAFRVLEAIMKITPLRLLYILSDLVFFVLYYILKYRKKVVYGNLSRSFPEKSPQEIDDLARKFYHHLSDIFAEGLKALGMNDKDIKTRFKVVNPEVVEQYHKQGKNVIMLGSHYANWEWGTLSVPMYLNNDIYTIYKPLSNKYINEHLNKNRADRGMYMVSADDALELFRKKFENPITYILLGDQSPHNPRRAFWMNFLHQESGFLQGADLQARRYDIPVVYFNTKKVKRGYYELTYEVLTDTPKEYAAGMITKEYARRLEEIINTKPEHWMWSHKRWKRKRPENKKLI